MFSGPRSSHPAVSRAGWLAAVVATVFAVLFLMWVQWPPRRTSGFLSDEPGQNLYLADRLLAGQTLYRDVWSQYGPLPIHAHTLAAAAFGNSADTFAGFILVAHAVNFLLVGRLLSRWLRPGVAAAWLCVILGGLLLRSPGANAYPPFEAAFFLGALLTWRAPWRRGAMRSLTMGALLGLMQTAKFGGVVFAGACIFVADVCQWRAEGRRMDARAWARALGWTAVGLLLVQGVLAAWVFAIAPAPDAADVLWPSYMRAAYRSYYRGDLGFLHWFDFGMFAGTQWPPIAAGAAAVLLTVALVVPAIGCRLLTAHDVPSVLSASHRMEYAGLAAGLGFFFPLAATFYLPHIGVASHYLWIPLAAAAGAFAFFRPWAGSLLALALACGAWPATVKPILNAMRPRPAPPETAFPNGQRLSLQPGEAAAFAAVVERSVRLGSPSAGMSPTWLVFPGTFGWEHYGGGKFRVGSPSLRHWWFIPAFVRPREEMRVVKALDQVDAVLVDLRSHPATGVGPDPGTWGWASPGFAPATNVEFATRLGAPEELAPNVWCFPVRR